MPNYLLHGSLTPEGVRGTLKEGGTSRRTAARQAIESAGGKLEAFYYAFGEDDFFVIADFPDTASAVASSLIVNSSGAVGYKTVVLITPEEMDQATKKTVTFRPPGR